MFVIVEYVKEFDVLHMLQKKEIPGKHSRDFDEQGVAD